MLYCRLGNVIIKCVVLYDTMSKIGVKVMEDLRKRRTKKLITDAFVKLVKQRGFVNVTVKDIASEAMINRQTFYNYYQDKYDLTQQLNDQMLGIFNELLQKRVEQINTDQSLLQFYKQIDVSSLRKYRELIQALMSIQFDNNSFRDRLQRLVIDFLKQLKIDDLDDLELTFISNFYIEMVNYVMARQKLLNLEELQRLRKIFNVILK